MYVSFKLGEDTRESSGYLHFFGLSHSHACRALKAGRSPQAKKVFPSGGDAFFVGLSIDGWSGLLS